MGLGISIPEKKPAINQLPFAQLLDNITQRTCNNFFLLCGCAIEFHVVPGIAWIENTYVLSNGMRGSSTGLKRGAFVDCLCIGLAGCRRLEFKRVSSQQGNHDLGKIGSALPVCEPEMFEIWKQFLECDLLPFFQLFE